MPPSKKKKKEKTGQSELLREKGYREAAAPAICPGSFVLQGLETQSLQAAVSDSRVTLRVPPSPTLPRLRDMGHTRTLWCLAFLLIFGCSPISGDEKESGLDPRGVQGARAGNRKCSRPRPKGPGHSGWGEKRTQGVVPVERERVKNKASEA